MKIPFLTKLILRIKSFLFLLTLFIFVSEAAAQSNIESFVKEGKFSEARELLPALVKENPADARTIYFQGLLEKDGETSLEYFESLLSKYPKSEYADDALMQISEYRYSRGLYISAERTLLMIPRKYPESEHIERAINLLMQAMLVTGKADTAKMYLDVFKKKWKNLDVELPESVLAKLEEPAELSDSRRNEEYTIQIGAFGSKKNAERQRDVFKGRGFKVSLGKKKVADKQLHLVWVGSYSSYDDALAEARVLKAKFGVNYGIVDRTKKK